MQTWEFVVMFSVSFSFLIVESYLCEEWLWWRLWEQLLGVKEVWRSWGMWKLWWMCKLWGM